MDFVKLSKLVSYALRHEPNGYGLLIDDDGWGDIGILITTIKQKHLEFANIDRNTIVEMIRALEKKRHEVSGERIRALYGHSIDGVIKKEFTKPPGLLYHGTSIEKATIIKIEGLKKMDRQYVHLSSDPAEAAMVASRKAAVPILLEINAAAAFDGGVLFYKENKIWLCDFIPSDLIRLMES